MAVVAAAIMVIAAVIISSGSSQDLLTLISALYIRSTSSVLKAAWSNHSAGKEMGGIYLT